MLERKRRHGQPGSGKGGSGRLPGNRVGQRPRQQADGGGKSLLPRRAVDRQRCGAVQAGQRLQQPRQAQNMVAMVVGQQHSLDAVGADAVPAQADLGTLAAVQQQGAALHRYGHGR